MEIFLLLATIYAITFVFGRIVEKAKIPWLFTPLFFGILLSLAGINITHITNTQLFQFLSQLGMIFLMFLIGFELDLRKFLGLKQTIIITTLASILLNVLFGTIIITLFGYSLIVAAITALTLATVGEAVLVPILEEFKLFRTKLGTTIIGIGTFDDLFEVLTVVFASLIIGSSAGISLLSIPISLFIILAIAIALIFFKKIESRLVKVPQMEELFLLALLVLFLFVGIGSYGSLDVLGALIAGIALRNFLDRKSIKAVEEGIKFVGYGFLAPVFFFLVGYSVNFSSIFASPALVLLIVLASFAAKIAGSFFGAKKQLGNKNSLLLGIALSVRFSTGIVVTQLLFQYGIIDSLLFSSVIASVTILTIAVPLLLSYLLKKWQEAII